MICCAHGFLSTPDIAEQGFQLAHAVLKSFWRAVFACKQTFTCSSEGLRVVLPDLRRRVTRVPIDAFALFGQHGFLSTLLLCIKKRVRK